jgi:cell division control protein 12
MIAYRAQQMETRKFGEAKTRKLDNPKFKEEEEALRKRFTEQVKLEEARFRQWEQRVGPVKIILIIAYCRTRQAQ